MLLGLINSLGFTLLQSAKMTFVQISEVVMTVSPLDCHGILSCDRLIKSYNLLCNDNQSGSSTKYIYLYIYILIYIRN
jgi:hypothetical protein